MFFYEDLKEENLLGPLGERVELAFLSSCQKIVD